MLQNPQHEQLTKVANKLVPKFNLYESIAVLVFLAGMLLKVIDLPGSIVMVLSAGALVILYFILAFAQPTDPIAQPSDRLVFKTAAYSSSVVVAGILYKLNHFHGSYIMLILGGTTALLCVAFILYRKFTRRELALFGTRMVIRLLWLGTLGLFLNFASPHQLQKLGIDNPVVEEALPIE